MGNVGITQDGFMITTLVNYPLQLFDFNFGQDPLLAQIKRITKELENYTCECCCRTNKEIEIHAHHNRPMYKFPELRYQLNNITIVCIYCHYVIHKMIFEKTGHKAEKRAVEYLQDRMGYISRYYKNIEVPIDVVKMQEIIYRGKAVVLCDEAPKLTAHIRKGKVYPVND